MSTHPKNRTAQIKCDDEDKEPIRILFLRFLEVERSCIAVQKQSQSLDDSDSIVTSAKMSEILQCAINIMANLIREVLVKLALWRQWMNTNEVPENCKVHLAEELVSSALRDLSEILGEQPLLESITDP